MTHIELEMINKLGLEPKDFEPNEEETTISDLVEALDILTNIVLGGDE